MPIPSQPVERVATRSTNVDQHPGSVVAPKRRRSKAEKARDDEFARLAIKKVQGKKKEDIVRVARLEDAMAVDDNNAESAYPRHAGMTFVASCSIDHDISYVAVAAPGSESALTEPESGQEASDFEESETNVKEPSNKNAPAKAGKSIPHGEARAIDMTFADIKSD